MSVTRFTRFCLIKPKQTPQQAVPGGITAYLDHLALERNVAPATQSQALNALSFLTKNLLGLREFIIFLRVPPRPLRLRGKSKCLVIASPPVTNHPADW